MQVFDLSMPVDVGHFRWPVQRGTKGRLADGDLFEAGWLHTTCHGFTHVDAPSHMVPGGPTLDALNLTSVVGRAAVIDITGIMPDQEISVERLSERAGHLNTGEIALFKTCWDEQRDYRTEGFWRDAPYLSRGACEWLLHRQPSAVAFDFPQDWTIRRLLDGEMRPIEEHVSHDVLLRNGITLIEYLTGMRQVHSLKTFLCAQPIKLEAADGAPARVIAIEGLL